MQFTSFDGIQLSIEAFKFLVDVKLSLIKLHSEKEHLSGDFEIFGVDPPQLAEIQNMEKVLKFTIKYDIF
jgi:hypothetical protein